MFFSTEQKWFLPGFPHTRPVQSVSCHGTLTERCAGGALLTVYQAIRRAVLTAVESRPGDRPLADVLPPRRPGTSVRKVKSPLPRYNKKEPYRPEPSTPITSIASISGVEAKNATREPRSLTTDLGP